jgi:hypothetical protein
MEGLHILFHFNFVLLIQRDVLYQEQANSYHQATESPLYTFCVNNACCIYKTIAGNEYYLCAHVVFSPRISFHALVSVRALYDTVLCHLMRECEAYFMVLTEKW